MARPIAKDHDQKRQLILKAAARVFAEEGIARASMNQVATACGISKANIYHYYASKDDLLFDILDSYLSELSGRVLALRGGSASPRDALERLLTEYLLAYEGMDHEHKIQTEALPLLAPDRQEVLKGYQRRMVSQMSACLRALNPAAFARDAAGLRDTTMSVFGMLNWFYMWSGPADAARRRAYAAHVARLCLSGIRGF